ncbi:hypothetical protein EJB05_27297, partial [Eragrostis curvula]
MRLAPLAAHLMPVLEKSASSSPAAWKTMVASAPAPWEHGNCGLCRSKARWAGELCKQSSTQAGWAENSKVQSFSLKGQQTPLLPVPGPDPPAPSPPASPAFFSTSGKSGLFEISSYSA